MYLQMSSVNVTKYPYVTIFLKNIYVIKSPMKLVEDVLKRNNLLEKPSQIWNCDESGISSHVATHEKAYGVKGETKYQQKVIIPP